MNDLGEAFVSRHYLLSRVDGLFMGRKTRDHVGVWFFWIYCWNSVLRYRTRNRVLLMLGY
ncbi:MAG: hypothetical protein EB015_20905 [Methylocystaceae bacterium]|nr:hypothetical protein [Methylocystaceae bacterium]